MYDKFLAILSMALFGLFMAIIALWVEEAPALTAVLVVTFFMGAYDFWRDTFSSVVRKKDKGSLL